MKRTLLTLFCTLLALAASADEGHVAPEPHLAAHRRHARQRIPPHGRRHLLDQQSLDEGCRGAVQRRLHGRTDFVRRAAAHQPPLRLRRHTGAFERRTRLPDQRLLGHVAPGGTAQQGAQRTLPRPHGRGHRPHHCGRNEGRNHPPGRGRRQGLQGLGRADVLRQPAVPVHLRAVRRRTPGRRAALVDRQVRRRHRQLDMAPPHGRLLALPHLRRQGQQARRLLARECSLPPQAAFHHLDRRGRRGGFHDDLRLPRQYAGVHPLGRRGLHRRALRPGQNRHPHGAPRHHLRGTGERPGAAHPLRRQTRLDRQRMEEMAGRGAGHRPPGHRGLETRL